MIHDTHPGETFECWVCDDTIMVAGLLECGWCGAQLCVDCWADKGHECRRCADCDGDRQRCGRCGAIGCRYCERCEC